MDKWIYKITNMITHRVYIGQSSNPEIRFSKHITGHTSKEFASDIKKYGKENFQLSIIKKCSDDFAKDEIDTIRDYKQKGYSLYNKTVGGEEPPTYYGENSGSCLYKDVQRDKVVEMILKTNYSYSEIAKRTSTSESFVRRTNEGKRPIDGLDYPLRTETHFAKISKFIIDDLFNTNLSQREIAKKYGVARSMVTMINIGTNRHDDKIEYPIRKIGVHQIPNKIKEQVRNDIQNGAKAKDMIDKYDLKNIYSVYSILYK